MNVVRTGVRRYILENVEEWEYHDKGEFRDYSGLLLPKQYREPVAVDGVDAGGFQERYYVNTVPVVWMRFVSGKERRIFGMAAESFAEQADTVAAIEAL